MSERPTPETDANESITCKEGDPCIAPDFARQLERERDEARELARELRGHLQNLVDHEVCNCCHDDEADADWLSAESALTKTKEVLG